MKSFKFQVGDVLMKRSSRAQYRPRYQVVIVAQGHLATNVLLGDGPIGRRYILASYFTGTPPRCIETKLIVGDDVDWFESSYKLFRRSDVQK